MLTVAVVVKLLTLSCHVTSVYMSCDQQCQDECLVFHNKYRLNHNVSTLVYDEKLAMQAQVWADSKILETSSWGKTDSGGECWAWGNIFPSWKAVIKTWHDQEKYYDWEKFKSKNQNRVGCFQQIVWAGATKLGCGVGIIDGLPFYVAQMDVPGIINYNQPGHAHSNVKKPLKPDIEWFNGDTDLLPNILNEKPEVTTYLKQF